MYLLVGYFCLSDKGGGLWYPYFVQHGSSGRVGNEVFVQVLNEKSQIQQFTPYFGLEHYQTKNSEIHPIVSTGEDCWLAFQTTDGHLSEGSFTELREHFLEIGYADWPNVPLLTKLVIARTFYEDAGIAAILARRFAKQHLRSETERKIFSNSSLNAMQKESAHWRRIKVQVDDSQVFNPQSEFWQMDKDELFVWMHDNQESQKWPEAYLAFAARAGQRDVLSLACSWLSNKLDSGDISAFSEKLVLQEVINSVEFGLTPEIDFAKLLIEVAENGEIEKFRPQLQIQSLLRFLQAYLTEIDFNYHLLLSEMLSKWNLSTLEIRQVLTELTSDDGLRAIQSFSNFARREILIDLKTNRIEELCGRSDEVDKMYQIYKILISGNNL